MVFSFPRTIAGVAAMLVAVPALAFAGQAGSPAPIGDRDAQGFLTMRAIALTSPLNVDGVLDEEIYTRYTPVSDFIQTEPTSGIPASEKTEVWVAYDRANLYVLFRAWESHPERMVVNEMRRDSLNIIQNEHVAFLLDTFHDRRNSYQFMITPSGARIDGQTTQERQYNGDLNPIWDLAVGRFDGGWTAEAAIPFKSLRYAPGRDRSWGFMARRVSRWKNEIAYTNPVPDGIGLSAILRASTAGALMGLETPAAARNLDLKPFVTGEATSQLTPGQQLSTDGDIAVGIDAKYGITQNISLDATVNTDFAQVEADEQQINLTRFSLFFPEKRDFFLENQGVFAFGNTATTGGGGGDSPTVFYSRRIGLETGQLVPLRAGGRVTGRVGGFELGVLNIQTGDESVSRSPSTNFGVVRVKRDLFRRSSIGGIVTRRSAMPGRPRASETYGVDGAFSFGANLMINSFWARTATPLVSGDDTSSRAQLDYAGDRYGLQLERLDVGKQFNPEIGFVRRADMRKSLAQLRFSPRPKSSRIVRKFSGTGGLTYIQNGDGRLETRDVEGDFAVEFQNSDKVSIGGIDTYEFLPAPFTIARGVTIPVGAYRFAMVRGAVNFGQQRRAFGTVSVEHGAFYDGTSTAVTVRGTRVKVTPRLSVEPSVAANWIDVAGHAFTTRVVGSRATYTLTPLTFVSALVQYNSSTNAISSNVRLRWEYAPGSELFVVYNDQRDTLARGFPDLTGRALIVKINRLFRF